MTPTSARVALYAGLHAASLLLMSACGGGGGSAPPPIPTYTISGSVSGLQGNGLVLQDKLGNDLNVANNGSFVFSTAIAAGSTYSVTMP